MSADLTWPAGVAKRILDEVDSTNAEAMRIASEISGPTWILAKRQTAARGRRGRAWANPEGNFAGTLVMRPIETPDQVALRSFVTALALRDALVLATGRPEAFALKWPNDVLLNGGKLAGILLETTGQVGALTLAIGIGVNLSEAPPPGDLEAGAVAPVSVAGETGVRIGPEEFLDLLAACYAKREESFTTHGFEPIRTAWLASAAHLGSAIRARTLTDEYHGTFEGIGADGALILTTGSGPLHLPAADVYF
ncbi:MAG: biotin--[acetyl-CoA-carboxylase] ligase [Pseudomonadota bacterium]